MYIDTNRGWGEERAYLWAGGGAEELPLRRTPPPKHLYLTNMKSHRFPTRLPAICKNHYHSHIPLSFEHIIIWHAYGHKREDITFINIQIIQESECRTEADRQHGLTRKLFTVLPSQADSELGHTTSSLQMDERASERKAGKNITTYCYFPTGSTGPVTISVLSGHPAALMTNDQGDLCSANISPCENNGLTGYKFNF